jgi:predicted glycogen debranching enzyme
MSTSSQVSIRYCADALTDPAISLDKEWLETNGIGGYASATLAGANTRRYHGLLVAALRPPVGRSVLLSKLDETVHVTLPDGSSNSYQLGANLYPGTTAPTGYTFLSEFESFPAPTWTYAMGELRLEKRIWMSHGSNGTYISYRLTGAPAGATLTVQLAPLVAWKDYHSEMHRQDTVPQHTWDGSGVLDVQLPAVPGIAAGPIDLRLAITDEQAHPVPGTSFEERWDWYMQFQHPREAERGLDFEEDLFSPGNITVPLTPDTLVTVSVSVGGTLPAPGESWSARLARQQDLMARLNDPDPVIQRLAYAADQFVAASPEGRTTIMAGYPWFADWGRDAMISLPGLTLATGRPEVARDILKSFSRYVDLGMLPNRFPDKGEMAEYNTVDAALWYFVAAYRYAIATGDDDFIYKNLWPALEEIVRYHLQGTRYGIRVDRQDWLLRAGQPGVQLTWMDAKVGDWVVTPRIGKPVEINALWCNALKTMAYFAHKRGDSAAGDRYADLAAKSIQGFLARFPRPDGYGLFDILDPDDATVRPNQIFAVALPFAPVDPHSDLARAVVTTVRSYLLAPQGLRTLTPNNFAYQPRYQGDQKSRDGAYHQGTVWPWLLGAYAESLITVEGDREGAQKIMRDLAEIDPVQCVGSLPEIYDAEPPRRPCGCIAQAWSVAETLRVLKMLDSP